MLHFRIICSRSHLPDTEKFEFDQKACQGDVESTLIELQLKYWIIKGRQTIQKIISLCVTCKKVQGKVLQTPTTLVLPEY